MKRIINSYLLLSRIERLAYVSVCGLLLSLIIVWQIMPYCTTPPSMDTAENERMKAIYMAFRNAHPTAPNLASDPDYSKESYAAKLFVFDPNTLDSAGFLHLGLSPKVVKGLMNWRNHGKHFYKKEDLKTLYNLSAEMYARLEPYINIPVANNPHDNKFKDTWQKLPPLPATLDLNTTDSATLVRLNGIGPTLAHKILDRRKVLGGFLTHKQLLEVYKFNDTVLGVLQQKLVIHPETIKKIAVNTASEELLAAHPYIGEKMAKNIILYRNALKRFDNITQLRQVPLMNEEIYRKIAPYLKVD